MGEVSDAYAGTRERMTALLRDADPTVRVPACPEWTVKDVAAHMAGVVDDVLAGRLDGVGSDPWTAEQVKTRADRPIGAVLEEWNEKAPAFEAVLDQFGAAGEQAVFDVVSHEHDVRGALRQFGAQDSDAVGIGLRWVAPIFVALLAEGGYAPLRVTTTKGQSWGNDDAPGSLRAPVFELARALSGRRSHNQIRGFEWSVDPEPYLSAFEFGPFHPPATDVVEATT
ncbi:MAG: hypothetical protein QOG87_2472 [Actinomycetota bacterium]|jgi:uncharacterized protein (TIGR03083 family)